MMKSKDVSAATSLIIQGYLHANSAGIRPERLELADCLNAIRSECDDWSENLDGGNGALEPSALSVEVHEMNGAPISRTPYNLISAAVALAREAVDLNGPSVVNDLVKRIQLSDSRLAGRDANRHDPVGPGTKAWDAFDSALAAKDPTAHERSRDQMVRELQKAGMHESSVNEWKNDLETRRANGDVGDAAADPTVDSLVAAANVLSTKIDASTDRPDALLGVFWQLAEDLRGLGVNVEDSVRPPHNWA